MLLMKITLVCLKYLSNFFSSKRDGKNETRCAFDTKIIGLIALAYVCDI